MLLEVLPSKTFRKPRTVLTALLLTLLPDERQYNCPFLT
jgi:hypothetical protein